MTLNEISGPVTGFIRPDTVCKLLGYQNAELYSRLWDSAATRKQISARIEEIVGPVQEVPEPDQDIVEQIIGLETKQLDIVARLVTALVQAPTIRKTTDGATLRAVSEFCGTQEIIWVCSEASIPQLTSLPPTKTLEEETLHVYARQIGRYLIGLLPPDLQHRLALAHEVGTLPSAAKFSDDTLEREDFKTLFRIALPLQEELQVSEEASDENPDPK